MLKCCEICVDVTVDKSCKWIASFDFDDNGECSNVWELDIETPRINELPFNDKSDVGFGVDGTGGEKSK